MQRYAMGTYSAPCTLPDYVEDGYESARDAWDSAREIYEFVDDATNEIPDDSVPGYWSPVPESLEYVEVWDYEADDYEDDEEDY